MRARNSSVYSNVFCNFYAFHRNRKILVIRKPVPKASQSSWYAMPRSCRLVQIIIKDNNQVNNEKKHCKLNIWLICSGMPPA